MQQEIRVHVYWRQFIVYIAYFITQLYLMNVSF